MSKKGKLQCSKSHCIEAPHLGGLCKEHYEEQLCQEHRRDAALTTLHKSQIEGRPLENVELRDELLRLQIWWGRACSALNYNLRDEILADEAKYALEWCIALAQEIVDAEVASRNGTRTPYSYSLEATREWVWNRFPNLEAGLMSNGVERPERHA